MSAVEPAAGALAGWRLGAVPLAAFPLDDLEEAARAHGFTGLLWRAVEAGDIQADAAARARVEQVAMRIAARSVQVEATLTTVLDALDAAGIRAVVLKGVATAHLDHVDPIEREFVDADVLVAPGDLAAAGAVLRVLGYQRNLPARRPRFDERFAKDITFQRAGAVEIDLHARLALGAFGLRFVPLGPTTPLQAFPLAGAKRWALDPVGRFLHACCDAVLAAPEPKLRALRDIALLSGRVDGRAVVARMGEWRLEVVVAAALHLTRSVLGPGSVGVDLVDSLRARPGSRLDRALLRTYPSRGGSNARCLLGGAAGAGGVGAAAGYLRGFLAPSREYTEARRRAGRPSERRTGWREVVHGVRGSRAR